MSFARRPTLDAKPAAARPAAAPVPAAPSPPPAQSLLDDPDAQSPAGLILRVILACVAAFILAAAVALWMKPAEWWEDESALPRPRYAHAVAVRDAG